MFIKTETDRKYIPKHKPGIMNSGAKEILAMYRHGSPSVANTAPGYPNSFHSLFANRRDLSGSCTRVTRIGCT